MAWLVIQDGLPLNTAPTSQRLLELHLKVGTAPTLMLQTLTLTCSRGLIYFLVHPVNIDVGIKKTVLIHVCVFSAHNC